MLLSEQMIVTKIPRVVFEFVHKKPDSEVFIIILLGPPRSEVGIYKRKQES